MSPNCVDIGVPTSLQLNMAGINGAGNGESEDTLTSTELTEAETIVRESRPVLQAIASRMAPRILYLSGNISNEKSSYNRYRYCLQHW